MLYYCGYSALTCITFAFKICLWLEFGIFFSSERLNIFFGICYSKANDLQHVLIFEIQLWQLSFTLCTLACVGFIIPTIPTQCEKGSFNFYLQPAGC